MIDVTTKEGRLQISQRWFGKSCHNTIVAMNAHIDALELRVKAMEKALENYATCGDGCTCGDGWDHTIALDALKSTKKENQ